MSKGLVEKARKWAANDRAAYPADWSEESLPGYIILLEQLADHIEQADKRIAELEAVMRQVRDNMSARRVFDFNYEAGEYPVTAEVVQMLVLEKRDLESRVAELEPQWIPCSERMPRSNEVVVAVAFNGESARCCGYLPAMPEMQDGDEIIPAQPAEWWLDSEGIGIETSGVTHWMPLPQPPGDS